MQTLSGLKSGSLAASAAGGLVAMMLVGSASAVDLTTAEDILNAADNPENWITHHGNYASNRYSTLDQINKSNVNDLKMVYSFGIGGMEPGGFWEHGNNESTPLVENGIIYTANGWGVLHRVNARRFDEGPDAIEWSFDPEVDKDWAGNVACCGINNRGVGLWQDSVIYSTLDGRMFRVHKETGEPIWSVQLAEPAIAETITVAPLIVKDMAITGVSGAEYGIRGWLTAVDLNTGEPVWQRYTVPGPGEPGHETWTDDHDAWLTGGGSTWVTGSYDPDLNLVYWGVGNPGPDWDHEYRPGDNLYTSGMIALNADTGKIEFYFQYTPNDPYDYDGVNELILVDGQIGGSDRKAMLHADRNGFFYAIDRTDGEFIYGTPFVKEITWTKGLDKVTGLPLDYDPASDVQYYVDEVTPSRHTGKVMFCPKLMGGKNWPPMAYNPETHMAYIPVIEGCGAVVNEEMIPGESYKLREWFSGGGPTSDAEIHGSITAMDAATGRVVAKADTRFPAMGGILTTAGDLVFVGHLDGKLTAYDAKTLDELWVYNTGMNINAPVITFGVDGKQYLMVGIGGGNTMRKYFPQTVPGIEKLGLANMFMVFTL